MFQWEALRLRANPFSSFGLEVVQWSLRKVSKTGYGIYTTCMP